MTNYTHKAVKGFAIIFVLTLLGAVAGYLFRLVLARNLTVAEYGMFYSAYAIIYIIFIFRDIGLGSAINKYIPEYVVKKQNSKLKSVIILTTIITVGISLLLSIVVIIFSNTVAEQYLKIPAATFFVKLIGIMFFLFSLEALVTNILSGLQKHWSYSIFQFLRQALPVIIILILFSIRKGSDYIIYSLILTSIIIITAFILMLNYIIPNFWKIKCSLDKKLVKKLVQFGLPVMFISIGGLILSYTDTIMITAFMDTTASGIYNAALPVAGIILYISAALSVLMFPLVSELWAKKFKEKLSMGIQLLYKYSFMLLLPSCFVIIAFSELVISVLFGAQYLAAAQPLRILIIGSLFCLFAQINFSVLSGIGKPGIVAKLTLTGAIINIVLNSILIPLYGLMGAAIATAIGYLSMMIASMLYMQRNIVARIPLVSWIKTVFISLATLFLIFWLKNVIHLSLYLETVLILIIAGLFYVLVSLILKQIDIYEIKDVIEQIRK